MAYLFFFVFSIVVGFLQVSIGKMPVVDAFLSAFLFVQVGLMGIYNFMSHYSRSNAAAEALGREKGSPFQKEVAFANLSYGVLGLLSIVLSGEFWTAGVLAFTTFSVGSAVVHLKEKRNENDPSAGKWGSGQWLTHAAAPLIMIVLLLAYRAGGN